MKLFNLNSLFAVLGSTVALVLWGMLFWAWLYEPFGIFNKLPDDIAVVELLSANGTETGTYFFPWPRNTPETFAAFVRQHQAGPFFQLSYSREGVDPQSPGKILRGVLHYFLVSLLAVALVKLTLSPSSSFLKKFLTVVLAGFMGTLFIRLGDPIWFHLPWLHALGNAFYEGVAWLLMGATVAWIIKE